MSSPDLACQLVHLRAVVAPLWMVGADSEVG